MLSSLQQLGHFGRHAQLFRGCALVKANASRAEATVKLLKQRPSGKEPNKEAITLYRQSSPVKKR